MSTLKPASPTVDNLGPRGRPSSYKKRPLPEPLTKEMYGTGMGSKAIATRLRVEFDIHVPYKTVQRVLTGERVSISP